MAIYVYVFQIHQIYITWFFMLRFEPSPIVVTIALRSQVELLYTTFVVEFQKRFEVDNPQQSPVTIYY